MELQATEHHYGRGEVVVRMGAPARAVWIVKSGRVHLKRYVTGGKAWTSCIAAPGDLFCCLSALDGRPYPVEAVAAVPSVLLSVPWKTFRAAMEEHAPFSRDILCRFCQRMRGVEHGGCMVYESVPRRIAQTLLRLEDQFGPTIPLTRHEVAELAGTTHETAIRALARFAKQDLVTSTRGRITIRSHDGLRHLLEEI